jgi:hypothetical protein
LISDLAWLFQPEWDSYSIRSALEGATSILFIPDNDNEGYIRPFHASLQDFLFDHGRSEKHFINPVIHHAKLFRVIVHLITDADLDTHTGRHVYYTYRFWCHHLLSSWITTDFDRLSLESLVTKLLINPNIWLGKLESHKEVNLWLVELWEVIKVSQTKVSVSLSVPEYK